MNTTTTGTGKRFYSTSTWRELSAEYRSTMTVCECCMTNDSELVDHVVPISAGGATTHPSNLMALCHRCHNIKRGKEAHRIYVEHQPTLFGLVPVNRMDAMKMIRLHLK